MDFKPIVSGLTKFFTREKIIIFIALIILAYALFAYSDSKSVVRDNLEDGSAGSASAGTGAPSTPETIGAPSAGGYALQPVANPADLLPKDQNSQWSALNPVAMNQGAINMPDILQAGFHVGLDSVGQSLRNANLQLRSDPPIIRTNTGPWLQSSIDGPSFQAPLEIGSGTR